MTMTYAGECPKCRTEHRREWRGEPWVGYDGEASFAAECHLCGPGTELQMFPEAPEEDEIILTSQGGGGGGGGGIVPQK